MLQELRLKINYIILTEEQEQEAHDFMDAFRQFKIITPIDYPNPFFQVQGIYEYTIHGTSFYQTHQGFILELDMSCQADMILFTKTNRLHRLKFFIKHYHQHVMGSYFKTTDVHGWPLSRFTLDLKSKI